MRLPPRLSGLPNPSAQKPYRGYLTDPTVNSSDFHVFNCGGETRYSQEDEVYKLRSLALSLAVGREAAKRGVKAFVELSTGMVYKSDSSPSKEQDKLKPWSKIAIYKLQAEEELAKIDG